MPLETAINEEMSKDERVKKEIRRLRSVYRDMDRNKLKIVDSLIKSAAFMSVSLSELEDIINEEGYTSEYQNGENQHGTKESAAVKIHLAMMKNHALVIRQLADLAPPERKKKSALAMLRDE